MKKAAIFLSLLLVAVPLVFAQPVPTTTATDPVADVATDPLTDVVADVATDPLTDVVADVATAPVAAPVVDTVKLKGCIIDNNCAGTQTPIQLVESVRTHTKECALLPACVASGYSIYADGKLSKFDKDSSAKIAGFLKKQESKLNVAVEVKKTGEGLSLISISNQ